MSERRLCFAPAATWLAVWLALPLLAAKAVHWSLPGGDYSWRAWARDLFVSTHADVAFVAGFGLLAGALLRSSRRWPRLHAALAAALLAIGALSAVYAVASIQIFGFLRSPLTYPLLYLAGDMGRMSSSFGAFLTPKVAVSMLAALTGYPLAVWLCWRPATRAPGRARRLLPAGLLAVAAAWTLWGRAAAEGRWSDRADLLIARSPHWEFLASTTRELLLGGSGPALPDAFPAEFLLDFRPAPAVLASGERGPMPGALDPASLALGSGSPPAREPPHARPRNVLLLVLESTGSRYLSLYGSEYPTTPHLEAEAAQALVFDNFYAHVGLSANSIVAISLSIYPYMTWREYTIEHPRFPGRTVAELLKERGYRTAFFSAAFLDYVGVGRFHQDRGFDVVRGWGELGGGQPLNSWGGDDALLIDRALQWIDDDPGRSFYGVVWTNGSHHPYDPPPERPLVDFFTGQTRPPDDYDLGRYLNTVAEADRQLGRLFAGLRRRGLDDDTIVIVTGDHGETFGHPHPAWGHGSRVYQESVQVPFVVWSPGLVEHGRRLATIGGHVDINPTITDLLGLPADPSWDGRSLFAKDRPPRAYFYAANDDYLLGVREGDFKYIYNASRGREQLFDLSRDPEEQRDVARAHPDVCRRLRQRLAAWKVHAGERLARATGGRPL